MYISNLEDVISILREKLPEYLEKKGVLEDRNKPFKCFHHSERSPSMRLFAKSNYETAYCFGCLSSFDIFAAASVIDNLPSAGPEWLTETIPALATMLDVPIALGEPTPQEALRNKFFALARDAADILQHPSNSFTDYMKQRVWENEFEDCYHMDFDELLAKLMDKGWERDFVLSAQLISISNKNVPLIGMNKATFIIKDHKARPIAFISRNLNSDIKYIHSAESPIFLKRQVLYGLDQAIQPAREHGLTVVEGPGDRFQLLRLGRQNVVALNGVALTEHHLLHIKQLGIKRIDLCLDWDKAGTASIERVMRIAATKKITGIEFFIVDPIEGYKDVDEFFSKNPERTYIDGSIKLIEAFPWLVARTDLSNMDHVQNKLITCIAASPTAIKRDMMANYLAGHVGVSSAAIMHDVERIRNNAAEEHKVRIVASVEKYKAAVESDPENLSAHMAMHEKEIEETDGEFGKASIGVNYQLARFDAIQDQKKDTSIDRSGFNLRTYTFFANAMANGLGWAMGALFLFGGRANAAKTATATAIGLDALINDPDTILILHLTDDNYLTVEPRLITAASYILSDNQKLTIGAAANPSKGFSSSEQSALYNAAQHHLRSLIAEERLVVLDAEDGNTTSVLQKTVKYIRRKYPTRKLLIIADGIHNYGDFPGFDQNTRIMRLVEILKGIATKYSCCVFATAEYRKSANVTDTTKIKYPVNDDLGDSRALSFRANVIVHVYNDVNDRMDNAEIFYRDPSDPYRKLPRLMLLFGKNKISDFKEKLALDLDPKSVTLKQISALQAMKDFNDETEGATPPSAKRGGIMVDTDYKDDDDE